jgi:uncharacterized membrane protein
MAAQLQYGRYLSDGWTLFWSNKNGFLLGGVVFWVTALLSQFMPPIMFVFGGPVLAGLFILALDCKGGGTAEFSRMMDVTDIFVPALIIGLLTNLFVGISVLLLIIPAFFVSGWYLFSYLFAIDQEMDGWEAMEKSRKFGFENHVGMAILSLIVIVINVMGAIPAGLGLIVTFPWTVCVITEAYGDQFGFNLTEEVNSSDKPGGPVADEGAQK